MSYVVNNIISANGVPLSNQNVRYFEVMKIGAPNSLEVSLWVFLKYLHSFLAIHSFGIAIPLQNKRIKIGSVRWNYISSTFFRSHWANKLRLTLLSSTSKTDGLFASTSIEPAADLSIMLPLPSASE